MVYKNLWWGFKRCNDTYQINRYYGDKDIEKARQSWEIIEIVEPFEAKDWQDAIDIVVKITK